MIPALLGVLSPTADLLLMVKPQFEVGKEHVGDGVVRDPHLRVMAVRDVALALEAAGAGIRGVVASPLPGPSGNVEYFVWAQRGLPSCPTLDSEIERAVQEGPQ